MLVWGCVQFWGMQRRDVEFSDFLFVSGITKRDKRDKRKQTKIKGDSKRQTEGTERDRHAKKEKDKRKENET